MRIRKVTFEETDDIRPVGKNHVVAIERREYVEDFENPIDDSENSWIPHFVFPASRDRREFGNLSRLSDVLGMDGDADALEILAAALKSKDILAVPVSCTSHSGDTYYTGAPRDKWDSGLVGVAWADSSERPELFRDGRATGMEAFGKEVDMLLALYNEYVAGEVYEVGILEAQFDADGNLVGDPRDDWDEAVQRETHYGRDAAEKAADRMAGEFLDENAEEGCRP